MVYDPEADRTNDIAGSLIGGEGGAIPGINVAAPGISTTLGSATAMDASNAAIKNAQALHLPQFSQGQFVAPDYAGDFTPGMYQTPEQADASTISTDPATRSVQMQALQSLIQQGNGAADAGQQAAQFKALDAANQMANARQGAIRQQMEARGQGGTGLNAMMQAQAAQDAANRAQGGTLDAQSQAALQKLSALGMAGNAAGAVRGQDLSQAGANADILNRFNMFNVNNNNAANQANVGMQNQAGVYNQGNRQAIMNARAGARNASLGRSDQNQQAMFGDSAQKTGMENTALQNKSGLAMDAAKAANDAGAQGFKNFKDLMSFGGGM